MNTFTRKLKTACISLFALLFGVAGTACDTLFSKPQDGDSSLSQSSPLGDNGEGTPPEETPPEKDEAFIKATDIMDMAYALEIGESLEGEHVLSGVVTEIDRNYAASRGIWLYFDVNEAHSREMYCYKLKGEGADLIGKGSTITVRGKIKNYKGTVEFDEGCTLVSYVLEDGTQGGTDLPDLTGDPYANMTKAQFYADYSPATSNQDAYYRSYHGFMSGALTVPDQAPTISSYQPKIGSVYLRNNEMVYEDNGDAYVVVDAYGNEAFTVYREGAYITLEEVAAYVYAFGTYPKNYTTSKNTDPDESVWEEYLRLNHTAFSGDTSRYPYEPVLPNISGCGGDLHYYEMDIGTTGTDCDPTYEADIYNDGDTITRGAARIVYGKNDLDKDGEFERGELHVFYTYNHYNDFQEYLNYEGGWGEMFGNITGGGSISSKYDCNPTDYVEVSFGELPTKGTRKLFQRYFRSESSPFFGA